MQFIYIFCIGVTLLIFGIFYLGFFAFPYPDMPPEEKAMRRLHKLVSGWCMFGGVVLVEVSIVGGVIKALGKRLASPLHKTLIGISFFDFRGDLRIISGLRAIKADPTRNALGGSSFCQCYYVISRLRLVATSCC